jgi:hypothetical protein
MVLLLVYAHLLDFMAGGQVLVGTKRVVVRPNNVVINTRLASRLGAQHYRQVSKGMEC